MDSFDFNKPRAVLPHGLLARALKGVLRQEFPELEQYYWRGGVWSPSYFIASSEGPPLDIVKQYIENQ